MDAYLRWAGTTGASFVPAWTNADVVLVSLAVFLGCFTLSAFARRGGFFDIAFVALVVGGILVSWPAMVAISIGAVVITMVVTFIHRALRPEESARITAEADSIAAPGVESFTQELTGNRAQRADSQHARERRVGAVDLIDNLGDYLRIAQDAIDSMGMTIALLIMGAILAGAGGLVSVRMRLYGAIVGGMIVNIVVKANGGGYAAALAAMLLATALAFAVGSTPFLVQLLRRVRPARR